MKTREDLRTTVATAIATSCYLEPGELRPELSLLDLGLDSLVIASIVASVETSIQRKFNPEELISLFEVEHVGLFIDRVLAIARAPT
jgi:acyl carrier protein